MEVNQPQTRSNAQLAPVPADAPGMPIEIDPWGGIAVHWLGADVWMLVDWTAHESWIVWRGRPIVRRATGSC